MDELALSCLVSDACSESDQAFDSVSVCCLLFCFVPAHQFFVMSLPVVCESRCSYHFIFVSHKLIYFRFGKYITINLKIVFILENGK